MRARDGHAEGNVALRARRYLGQIDLDLRGDVRPASAASSHAEQVVAEER
jgi:hypothetical protein